MDCFYRKVSRGLDERLRLGRRERETGAMDYTKRRNLNRGYMKLECWQRGMDLFVQAFHLSSRRPDLKMRSQFRDAAQSVSANIAEGYGRRSLAEYLQFLNTAKGSLGETLTRAIGVRAVDLISADSFERFDQLHYEVENKLLRLIDSLERKRSSDDWCDSIAAALPSIHPKIQSSKNRIIPKSIHPRIQQSSPSPPPGP